MSVGAVAAVLALGGVVGAGYASTAQAAEPQQRIVYTESSTIDGVLTYSLVSMNADGTDRRTLVPTGEGLPQATYDSPVFSPDGRHLAFISEDGFGDIWVANPDGSAARPVAMDVQDPDGWVTQLAWGANSDMLYLGFQSKPGHDRLRLMKVQLDGSGLGYVLPDQPNVYDGQPSVAPNGTLAFLHGGTIEVYDPRQGGTPTPLTSGLQPAYSPDGTKLAFTRQASNGFQVFVRDLASGKETQITDDPSGVASPSWSPDGSKLAYLAGGTTMRLTVHSATAAGGAGTAITTGGVQGEGIPAWVIPVRSPGPGADLTGDGKPDLVARDSSGTLWLYKGTGSATGPYAARTKVGSGWNTFNSLVSAGDLTGDAKPDLVARDASGTLWLYKGTGNATSPYNAARTKIGTGWNTFNSLTAAGDLTGDGRQDLVARDASGVLWLYKGTGNATSPYNAARTRIGSGWNTYNRLNGAGDLTGDGKQDLVARDASGTLWLYKGTGNATGPYATRTRIGTGWNTFNSLTSTGDLTGDGKPDLVARDASGTLWLYKGTGNATSPYNAARTRIGSGWNTYSVLC
ncbi:FG-GAP-like repeat-containing protein [Streptomyces cocklensis]|uniref:FG-GAP-like repeat-containing protein n=1 Tax=Actinacidiphila cocklensis TaxID=887465 RepID=UPI00203E57A4|nr:FG-GAP-like repeat-containing protein [Actinacidiphila cocklensis]MDD1057223.1 FG-GAP-like repeat-containing protein [Actinacidiphila cocklensis]